MTERLLRLPEVVRLVGLRRSAIYARIQRQQFPGPVKLGQTTVFVESEIQAWIAAQIRASRDGEAAP